MKEIPYNQYDYRETDVWGELAGAYLREVESGSLDAPAVLLCGAYRAHTELDLISRNWVQAVYVEREPRVETND